MSERLISDRFPYIPMVLSFGQKRGSVEALLDTGFEGDVIIPESFALDAGPSDGVRVFRLADGSRINRAAFGGTVSIGGFSTIQVLVVALGDECLMGVRLASRFSITLDHGRRLLIEP